MRGNFSIEWMAQSSRSGTPETPGPPGTPGPPETPGPPGTPGPGPAASDPESLPGFYWKPQLLPPQGQRGRSSGGNEPLRGGGGGGGGSRASESSLSSGGDSDYESEGGGGGGSASSPPPPCGRRSRTAFTAEQIRCLEKSFKRNAYLGTQDKAELCRKLHLSDKQVRNWFQNRRMKMKRSVQDALAQACQSGAASRLLLYSELQAYRAAPYHPYPPPPPPDGRAAAPYAPPPYGAPPPLDSLYQYGGFPGVALPPAAAQYRASYPGYPPYY